MLNCRFSSCIFDIRKLVNFITCLKKDSKYYGSLVNSHQCSQCPFRELVDFPHVSKEGPFSELRPKEVIEDIFNVGCKQCTNFDEETMSCTILHTSETILEWIRHPNNHCPRHLW
jgi:hypothetical protein